MGMVKSKLVDKNTYIKWYNLSREEVNDENLIPERSKEEIFDLISRENWLLFCKKEENKEIATQKSDPNVFFDVLSKEGNLKGLGRLGLTFNNLGAYDKFRTIMRGENRELKNKITKELLGLKYDWKMKIHRKVKENNFRQTPEYEEDGSWDTKEISENIIDEVIEKAKKIRKEGTEKRIEKKPKYYCETPTINLMEMDFKLDEEEFKDRISEIFKILVLCLSVKGDVEVNKIIREKVKLIKDYVEEFDRLDIEIPKKKNLIFLKQITEESINKDIERKDWLEKEIEILSNEAED